MNDRIIESDDPELYRRLSAHIITDDGDVEIARVHSADPRYVNAVIENADPETRSGWVWARLPNGDLILGVFPRGDTYEAVQVDAVWPGTEEEKNMSMSMPIEPPPLEKSYVKSAIFDTTDVRLRDRSGQQVEVLGLIHQSEEGVAVNLYRVRFQDGFEIDAFPDDLHDIEPTWSNDPREDELTDLLHGAKRAHSEYEAEHGMDADWARWYARWMLDQQPTPQGQPSTSGLATADATTRRIIRQLHDETDFMAVDRLHDLVHALLRSEGSPSEEHDHAILEDW